MKLFSGSTKRARAWEQAIDSASLPEAVKQTIRQVTRGSRLWDGEKRAVANELIGHFADGLESGRIADDLIHTFGNPKLAAKLIRRSMRRQRPWWWQMQWRMQQATVALLAFYLGLWALLAMDHPEPKVDYLAIYNAAADRVPEQDKAWPIYRKAIIEAEYTTREIGLDIFYAPCELAEGPGFRLHPTDRGWDKIEPHLLKYQSLIQSLRIGATKPVLGNHVFGQDIRTLCEEDRTVYGLKAIPPTGSSSEKVAPIEVLMSHAFCWIDLRHLALMRSLSNWLVTDMIWATYQNDGDRVSADYDAIIGISRQLHQPHSPIIEQLVSFSIVAMGQKEMEWILYFRPEVLSDTHLRRIGRESDQLSKTQLFLSTEQDFMLDMIQRTYSDNGRGNGHLTFDFMNYGAEKSPAWLQPFLSMMVISRSKAEKSVYIWADDFMAVQNQSIRQILQFDASTAPLKASFLNRGESPIHGLWKNPILQGMTMGLTSAAVTINRHKTHCQALATAAAMELYRRQHGQYPQAISDLVPEYLPTHPIDRSTNEPLLYKLVDGKPLLYGRGLNGTDDGGVMTRQGCERWPNIPEDGDWILFPPPECSLSPAP